MVSAHSGGAMIASAKSDVQCRVLIDDPRMKKGRENPFYQCNGIGGPVNSEELANEGNFALSGLANRNGLDGRQINDHRCRTCSPNGDPTACPVDDAAA